MNSHSMNSPAWIYFCYINFGLAAFAIFVGIWAMAAPLTMKAFLAMGVLFLTGSSFNLAKVLRDEHEARKFHNRLDEAKTERLLRDVDAA